MKIKNKIIISISLISALSISIIGIIMYFFITNLISNRVNESLEFTLKNNIGIVEEWINGKTKGLKMMKDTLERVEPKGIVDSNFLLGYKNDSEISALFVAYEDKSIITEQKLPPNFDATTRPWYIKAKEKNDLIITNPFFSEIAL